MTGLHSFRLLFSSRLCDLSSQRFTWWRQGRVLNRIKSFQHEFCSSRTCARLPVLCREGLGPRWTPSQALTGHALQGHSCCNVVIAQGPQVKGNTAKIGVLLMGIKEGAAQDIFAAHLGTQLESVEAYVGVVGRPVFLEAMQLLEVTGRDAGGETQPHRALSATCCQSPVAQCHPSSSSPRLCCCWDMVMVFSSSSALMSSFV